MNGMQAWLEAAAGERVRQCRVRRDDVRRNPETQGGLLDLASNDYLGLAGDERLRRAAIEAIGRFGTGSRASRVVTGTSAVHAELEDELARLTGQPTCLAFATGYAANLGILTALGSPDTLLITDAHIHASLIDAARLSRSPVQICPHRNLETLEQLLQTRHQPRAVVVVESIYSVLGDATDLTATAALCAEHDALLVVDEAHGIGVAGDGRGAVQAAGLAGAEHVAVTATLSKALGSQGGAVLGSELLREHLVNTARTFIFDTALAPAAAAAATAACRVIAAEPQRVRELHAVAAAIAAAAGIERAAGAVQSIQAGAPEAALAAAQRMYEAGVLVGCFRPPSVPDGISRLRLTARARVDVGAATAAAELAAEAARGNTSVGRAAAGTAAVRATPAWPGGKRTPVVSAARSDNLGSRPILAVLPRVLFVTGTDTGVGKTIVTASLAAALTAVGRTVVVYKPTQAGLEDGAGDIDRVRLLAGVHKAPEGIRLPHPMAPVASAERAGLALPGADAHAAAIQRQAAGNDHVLVEGVGGVLVELDQAGRTLADIAAATAAATEGPDGVGMIVVCRATLGTLNHTELTVEALRRRGIAITGLVIGAWPEEPTEIDLSNRDYLSRYSVPLLGAVPARAGQLEPGEFRTAAPQWLWLAPRSAAGRTSVGNVAAPAGRTR